MAIRFIVVAAVLTVSGVVGLAQSKPSLQGVWRKVEVTITNPNPTPGTFEGHTTDVQPGLLIFTAKHFSNVNDTAAKPRPKTRSRCRGSRPQKRCRQRGDHFSGQFRHV